MKESLYTQDKRLVFRECFNSEQDTRKAGGVPTSITYSNGVSTYNGTTSKIVYRIDPLYPFNFSIRIKFKTNTTARRTLFHWTNGLAAALGFYIDILSTGYVRTALSPLASNFVTADSSVTVNNDLWHECIVTYNGSLSGVSRIKLYVDGVDVTASPIYIGTVSSPFLLQNEIKIGTAMAGISSNYIGDCEFWEKYSVTLTSSEVALLYKNALYKEPTFANEVLSIDPSQGLIADKYGNAITNTAVTNVRGGVVNVMNFNGTTSTLITSTLALGTGAFTMNIWVYFGKANSDTGGMFVNNSGLGMLYFRYTTDYIIDYILYDGANGPYSFFYVGDIRNKWNMFTYVFNGNKTVTVYQNGVQKSASTNNNFVNFTKNWIISIFYRAGPQLGRVGKIKIATSAFSQEQITQFYNSTKHLYQQ